MSGSEDLDLDFIDGLDEEIDDVENYLTEPGDTSETVSSSAAAASTAQSSDSPSTSSPATTETTPSSTGSESEADPSSAPSTDSDSPSATTTATSSSPSPPPSPPATTDPPEPESEPEPIADSEPNSDAAPIEILLDLDADDDTNPPDVDTQPTTPPRPLPPPATDTETAETETLLKPSSLRPHARRLPHHEKQLTVGDDDDWADMVQAEQDEQEDEAAEQDDELGLGPTPGLTRIRMEGLVRRDSMVQEERGGESKGSGSGSGSGSGAVNESSSSGPVLTKTNRSVGDRLRGFLRSVARMDFVEVVPENEQKGEGGEGQQPQQQQQEIHIQSTHPLVQKVHQLYTDLLRDLHEQDVSASKPPVTSANNQMIHQILLTIVKVLLHRCRDAQVSVLMIIQGLPVTTDYGWLVEFSEFSLCYGCDLSSVDRDVFFLKYLLQRRALHLAISDFLTNQPDMIEKMYSPDSLIHNADNIAFFLHLVSLLHSLAYGFTEIPPLMKYHPQEVLIPQFRIHASGVAAYFLKLVKSKQMTVPQIGNEKTNPPVGPFVRDTLCRSLANIFAHGLKVRRRKFLGIGKDTFVWDMLEHCLGTQDRASVAAKTEFFRATSGVAIEHMLGRVTALVVPRPKRRGYRSDVWPPRRTDASLIPYSPRTISRIRFVTLMCLCLNHRALKAFVALIFAILMQDRRKLMRSYYDDRSLIGDQAARADLLRYVEQVSRLEFDLAMKKVEL